MSFQTLMAFILLLNTKGKIRHIISEKQLEFLFSSAQSYDMALNDLEYGIRVIWTTLKVPFVIISEAWQL